MIMELPCVSVIVLNWNGREHLEPCFRSLMALEYPPERVELLLVDNGSTDGSVEYVQTHFPQVRVIRNERNLGFAAGNNIGARAAQGEIVAFLNNDMRADPRWLRELVAPFTQGGDVAAVGGQVLSWDGKRVDFAAAGMNFYGYGYQLGAGERARPITAPDRSVTGQSGGAQADSRSEPAYDRRGGRVRDSARAEGASASPYRDMLFVCGGNMAVRREVFLEVGGFDEDFFAYYEDLDLGWRLWVLGYRVLFTPQAITYHRHHGTARRLADEKRRLLYERNALYTIIKNYEEENLRRVLPVALLLLLERCYLLAGLDAAAFRLVGEGGPPPLERVGDRYTLRYYLRRAWQALREGGPAGLWAKVKGELHWRAAHPAFRGLLGRRRARRAGEDIAVPPQALSGLVAADDLIRHLPRLWEKRQAIQAARRRSDAEIFPLFGRPLELSFFDPDYQAAQEILVRLWEVDRLFEGE